VELAALGAAREERGIADPLPSGDDRAPSLKPYLDGEPSLSVG